MSNLPSDCEGFKLEEINDALVSWSKTHQGEPRLLIVSRAGWKGLKCYARLMRCDPATSWYDLIPLIDPSPAAPVCRIE